MRVRGNTNRHVGEGVFARRRVRVSAQNIWICWCCCFVLLLPSDVFLLWFVSTGNTEVICLKDWGRCLSFTGASTLILLFFKWFVWTDRALVLWYIKHSMRWTKEANGCIELHVSTTALTYQPGNSRFIWPALNPKLHTTTTPHAIFCLIQGNRSTFTSHISVDSSYRRGVEVKCRGASCYGVFSLQPTADVCHTKQRVALMAEGRITNAWRFDSPAVWQVLQSPVHLPTFWLQSVFEFSAASRTFWLHMHKIILLSQVNTHRFTALNLLLLSWLVSSGWTRCFISPTVKNSLQWW